MKKILIAVCLCAFFLTSAGQVMRFGLKGAYNSTWMFNTNISDKGEEIDYASAYGSSFGITTSYHFNDETGISVDVLMATHNAKYKGTDFGVPFEATDKISYIDLPVLFRLGPNYGGGYVELGPQFSFLGGAKQNIVTNLPVNKGEWDVERDFNGTHISAILGFGYDFDLSENWLISAGMRFCYGFGDATLEFNETELESTDRSIISDNAHYDSNGNFRYSPTHRFYGGLSIAILYSPSPSRGRR